MNEAIFSITYTTPQPTRKHRLQGLTLEHAKERAFYDLTASYNYISYSLNGQKVSKNKTYLDYMSFKGEEQKNNTGVFNTKKVLDKKELEKLKTKIGKTQSIIWHGFISFNKEQSKRFVCQEDCIAFLKQTMSTFFEESHINQNNIELFASLHTDKSHHHHIHFSFFEKEPMRKDKYGNIEYSKKGSFSKDCIKNYMLASNLYLSETKDNYHIARDCAIEELKQTSRTIIENKESNFGHITQRLLAVAKNLPENGRLQYGSKMLDENIKKEIDSIANEIMITNKDFGNKYYNVIKEINAREQECERIAKENKMYMITTKVKESEFDTMKNYGKETLVDENTIFKNVSKIKIDIRCRIGNVLLGTAKKLKKIEKMEKGKNKIRKARPKQKSIVEKELFKLIHNKALLNIKTDYSKDLHRAEYEIKKEQRQKEA